MLQGYVGVPLESSEESMYATIQNRIFCGSSHGSFDILQGALPISHAMERTVTAISAMSHHVCMTCQAWWAQPALPPCTTELLAPRLAVCT